MNMNIKDFMDIIIQKIVKVIQIKQQMENVVVFILKQIKDL